jgi:hypothetical protein
VVVERLIIETVVDDEGHIAVRVRGDAIRIRALALTCLASLEGLSLVPIPMSRESSRGIAHLTVLLAALFDANTDMPDLKGRFASLLAASYPHMEAELNRQLGLGRTVDDALREVGDEYGATYYTCNWAGYAPSIMPRLDLTTV